MIGTFSTNPKKLPTMLYRSKKTSGNVVHLAKVHIVMPELCYQILCVHVDMCVRWLVNLLSHSGCDFPECSVMHQLLSASRSNLIVLGTHSGTTDCFPVSASGLPWYTITLFHQDNATHKTIRTPLNQVYSEEYVDPYRATAYDLLHWFSALHIQSVFFSYLIANPISQEYRL